MRQFFAKAYAIPVLVILFFTLLWISHSSLSGLRIDLTENKIYSLSDGSKAILRDLPEGISLSLYYSNEATKGMTNLRNYAEQVEQLLREYESLADGRLNLQLIDPIAFSAQEDEANAAGLTAAPIDGLGNTAYFGLVGTNANGDQFVIPFFDPQKEQFLEYDISKLIYQLTNPQKLRLTLLTDVPMSGGQNPLNGQFTPPNVIYSQLNQLFDVELLSLSAEQVPEDTDVLMLVHPQNVSDKMLYQIDQYLMAGGKALVFVDSHFESDQMAMFGGVGVNQSELDLLEAYGIRVDSASVILDAATGLDIRNAQGGVTRHYGFLGLLKDNINQDELTTAALETVNGASFTAISLTDEAKQDLSLSPLLYSSKNTFLLDADSYANQQQAEALARNFVDQNTSHVLAARIVGKVNSYFDEKPDFTATDGENSEQEGDPNPDKHQHIASTEQFNMVLISDVDILIDRFWVQQQSFFGQSIYNAFANNGDLVTNLVENLGGSEGLIGVRSRASLTRPFDVVKTLELKAQAEFRDQEARLQAQLEETENQLTELQQQDGSLELSEEQQQALEQFIDRKIEIRRALREVQYQLDKDINQLGTWLKLINIAIAPLLLTAMLRLLFIMYRKRQHKQIS